MAYLGWPSAVKQSTNAYWNDRGMTPIMNTRMPQTDFSAISAFWVNSRTNGCAQNMDITVINVVNTRQATVIHSSALFISRSFFAP